MAITANRRRQNNMLHKILVAVLCLLTACAPATATGAAPQLIKINASAATQPWLVKAYNCADSLGVVLFLTNDPARADISLRMGEPEELNSKAFQIGRDDLLVVTQRESPLQNLNQEEVRNLFAWPDESVQVWVFAPGEDVEQVFAREVMSGQIVSSLARIALSPQQMSDALNRDKKAVGILPRGLMAGNTREIFSLTGVPVLALTKSEPGGLTKALLACLQK